MASYISGVYERSDANESAQKRDCQSVSKALSGMNLTLLWKLVENGVHYLCRCGRMVRKQDFSLIRNIISLAMQRICKGKKVLDCFTHMGTFALNAGIAGASDVTGLDISEYAVSQAVSQCSA